MERGAASGGGSRSPTRRRGGGGAAGGGMAAASSSECLEWWGDARSSIRCSRHVEICKLLQSPSPSQGAKASLSVALGSGQDTQKPLSLRVSPAPPGHGPARGAGPLGEQRLHTTGTSPSCSPPWFDPSDLIRLFAPVFLGPVKRRHF